MLAEIPPSLQFFWNLPLDSYLSYLHVLAEIPPLSLQIFLKSATGQLPRLPSWNIPLDSHLSYPHVLTEIPPEFADFLKSATGQLPKLPSWNLPFNNYLSYLHVLAEIPPSLQFFWNLPLVTFSYLSYLPGTCAFACRNSPPQILFATGQITFWNLPLDSYLSYQIFWNVLDRNTYMYLQIFPPWFADFLKSATGQLPNLPTCVIPLPVAWNVPLDSYLSYLHVLARNLPICACSNPPSLQIFWNLPLDSFLHVLLEIPPTSFQIFWNLPLDSYLSYLHMLAEIPPGLQKSAPPTCLQIFRCSEICHWTVT